MTIQTPLGITGADDKWAYFRLKPFDYSDKLYYDSRGPWPTPAPGRPLSEVAEVANLPKEEFDDWKKNVRPKYIKKLLLGFIPGLWWAYVKSGGRYIKYDDDTYDKLFSRSMYSKFICKLDKGDEQTFSEVLDTNLPLDHYRKLDFAGMEYLCGVENKGMHSAASVVLMEPNGTYSDGSVRYKAIAIYLYSFDSSDQKQFGLYQPDSDNAALRRKWDLAKYFSLQGAVHRINMTEHGRLHFPLDTVNAVTKSILPVDHPLFVLLIPHLRLSLAVNNNVLESNASLISRTNWTIYTPFVAAGKYVRRLISDGYVGRADKPNAFPEYEFPTSKFDPDEKDTSFNRYRSAYYTIFHEFVTSVLSTVLAESYTIGSKQTEEDKQAQQDWEFIALWAECIREWIPGYIGRERLELGDDLDTDAEVKPNLEVLIDTVTYIIWNVTVSHAADHSGFAASGPQGNIFRLHLEPPFLHKDVPEDFEKKLVKRWDLFQSYLTNVLFYSPMNAVTLENVIYDFDKIKLNGDVETKRSKLNKGTAHFMSALKECDNQQMHRDPDLCPLADVSSSIQY